MVINKDKRACREIRNLLKTFPGILDVSVVGIADDVCGEAIKAFIVMREGIVVAKDDIIRFCTERLPGNTKPIFIEFL